MGSRLVVIGGGLRQVWSKLGDGDRNERPVASTERERMTNSMKDTSHVDIRALSGEKIRQIKKYLDIST